MQGEAPRWCRQLALEVLSLDDVVASLARDTGAQAQAHGLLWHRAAALLRGGDPGAARGLFSAAFQLARPGGARAKAARALAACHAALGEQQRALEYLGLAARQEGATPSALTLLARLRCLVHAGQGPAQGIAGGS